MPPNTARAREAAANSARAREAAANPDGTETRGRSTSGCTAPPGAPAYVQAIAAVALVAVLIALAASNTAQVKVNWVIASSHISLVWLVLVTAIVGWLLGLLASARFNWRTRAPRHRVGTTWNMTGCPAESPRQVVDTPCMAMRRGANRD